VAVREDGENALQLAPVDGVMDGVAIFAKPALTD
jgi:hypothetical protein